LTKWSTTPELPSWTWPGQEGKSLKVDVYSRYDSVQLYLDGKLLGEKATGRAEEFKAVFDVPYAPGKLEAVGMRGARVGERFTLRTAAAAAAIRLNADHTTLKGDGQDLAFLTLEITDPAGTLDPTTNPAVQISVTGPGTVAGIANADMTSMEPYYANPRHTFQGRSLVVIRTQHAAGWIKVTASAPGLSSAHVTLRTTPQP
jgi:beta-galactosidase